MLICLLKNVYFFFPLSISSLSVCFQGLDEEAIVDHGKTSFTINTNYEKEDLESKVKAKIFLCLFK